MPIPRVLTRALLMLAAVTATACSRGADGGADAESGRSPGEEARQLAVEVDRAVARMTSREWTSTMGDATATLAAFSAGDSLRLVRERLDQGEMGTASNRYYFADGRLRYYESEGDHTTATRGKAPVTSKERLVLAFDVRGEVVEGTHQLDGNVAPLDSVQIAGVRNRAQEIQRQFAAEGAPSQPR
jgi:hypothetical protein